MKKNQFPVVPVLACILRIAAVIILIQVCVMVVMDAQQTFESWKAPTSSGNPFGGMQPAITGFGPRLQSLFMLLVKSLSNFIIPLLVWGAADFLAMIRRIVLNTSPAIAAEPMAETPAQESASTEAEPAPVA